MNVILLMAGAQPSKAIMWDTALESRPKRFPVLKDRFGWWRNSLFDVNNYPIGTIRGSVEIRPACRYEA